MMQIKSRYTSLFIICLSITSTILSWDGSYEGGDIAGARRSFLGQNPIDLWGGFSGFFYGNIPNSIFPWGLWLLFLQMTCAATGLILISKHVRLINKTQHLLFFILSYLILSFTGYLTRDSTMASFYILGFGLILFSNKLLKTSDIVMFFSGTLFIILAVAFRPWLFFAALLPAIFLHKLNFKILVFTIILILSPLCIDRLTYLTTDYKKVHPELQVIISDLASMTCLSSNDELRKNGTNLLNSFSNTIYSNGEICGDFRLNTWQSVGSWSLNSSEIGLEAFNDASSRYSKILISSDMTARKYTEIRNSWLNLLANNPKDYLQVKSIHANQIMISGDTFGLRILNTDSSREYFAGIFFAPFDTVISLHLLSPALTFLIGFIIIILRLSTMTINKLIRTQEVTHSFLFVFCWVLTTSIAYIGDNGRYTYLSSFIFYILLFLGISKVTIFPAEEEIDIKSRVKLE
jgi:hypothetical protein